MLNIKVARVPGMVKEITVPLGSTVGDALRSADVMADGCTLTINGATVNRDSALVDGQTILVAKQSVKGA